MSSTQSPVERYLADEGVDFRIVRALRDAGYSIVSVREESPSIPDTQVLARALELDAVLLTED